MLDEPEDTTIPEGSRRVPEEARLPHPAELAGFAERSFYFSVHVVSACEYLQRNSGVVRALAANLLEAGAAVGSHVKEAQAAPGLQEATERYTAALRECRKVVYWLSLLINSGVKDEPSLRGLHAEGSAIAKVLSKLLTDLLGKEPLVGKKRDLEIDSELRKL